MAANRRALLAAQRCEVVLSNEETVARAQQDRPKRDGPSAFSALFDFKVLAEAAQRNCVFVFNKHTVYL